MSYVKTQPIRIEEAATIRVDEAAQLLNVSRDTAYREIKTTGFLNGIAAIRVGRRLIIPRRPFMAALGIDQDSA
jgi:excisionase family DNA binding protein